MTNPVYVVGDENGSVITLSKNNPEFGWITVRQDSLSIDNGWANRKSLSAIIMGRPDILEAFDLAAGEILSGKIVVVEQLKPFSSEDKDLKIAGSTGIVCKSNGQPIYRKTFYTTNVDAQSVFIQHDNADEIRMAQKFQNNKIVSETSTVEELQDVFEI